MVSKFLWIGIAIALLFVADVAGASYPRARFERPAGFETNTMYGPGAADRRFGLEHIFGAR